MDDLRNLRVGVGRGNADDTFLTSIGFEKLEKTNTQKQSLQMLKLNRIDVTPMGELVMPEFAKEAGIDSEEIERVDVKLYESVLYIAFSKNIPDNEIEKWQEVFDEIKSDGTYDKILGRYILSE